MKRLTATFDDLLDAFEFLSAGQPFEHEAYLCLGTGAIHYHSELGDLEEGSFLTISTTRRSM